MHSGEGSSMTLRVLAEELPRRGVEMWPVLRRFGFTKLQFFNPLTRVSRRDVIAFSEHCAKLLNDDAFHVHATARAELGAFGVADFIAMMAPTIGEGFSRVARAYSFINSALEVAIVPKGSTVQFQMRPVSEPKPHWIDTETLAVAAAQRFRQASKGNGPLVAVFSGKDRGYTAVLEQYLGCRVRWGRQDVLTFRRRDWNERPQHFHPALLSMLGVSVKSVTMPTAPADDVVRALEQVVEAQLGDTTPLDAKRAAATLGLSARTLQRRLAERGTSYERVLDGLRERRARALLSTGAELRSVSEALRFSEPSAFSRAFKRWTKQSPSEFQAGRREGPAR